MQANVGNKGIVLVVAMLVMCLLSLLGVTFLGIALTEHQVARNHYHQAKAFNIAEAGLERGRHALKDGNIIPILAQGGVFAFGSAPVPFGGGTYRVLLVNNCTPVNGHAADVAGCASNTDGDNRALVLSLGKYENATRLLATVVEAKPGPSVATVLGWWELPE